MKKLALMLGALGAPLATFAEGAGDSLTIHGENGLWTALGLNFGTMVKDCFQAMASPLGVVVLVVFTMAIFALSVKLLRVALKGGTAR